MNDKKDDGGSAFPEMTSSFEEGINREPGYLKEISSVGGMSLRDYFAAKALQGMCSGMSDDHIEERFSGVRGAALLAGAAYIIADAMLKTRSKP